MKRTESKLKKQEELTTQQQTAAQQGSALEFATPEEMLRHDAKNTVLPITIENRLRESLAHEPSPSRSWWQRLFGR